MKKFNIQKQDSIHTDTKFMQKKQHFAKKQAFIFLAILVFNAVATPFCVFALELKDVNSKLSDVFASFSDSNEGTTVFRSLNIPTGGRSESLGTAITGLCDDITFFDYNPAGSAVLSNSEIAFFHNSWIADSAMETLEGSMRFNNLGMGLQLKCFYVPFTEYNLFGDKLAGNYYSETSLAFNMAYNFLAGYNFKGIAAGYTMRASWRNMPDYADNQTDKMKSGSGLEQSALGFMADFGLLVRFNFLKNFSSLEPNFNFGLALNNLGLAFTGFSKNFELDDSLPTRISAGFSYRLFKNLLFTTEFRQPVNLMNFSSSQKFSFASGAEINVTDFFDFEAGFMLSGGNPRFSIGSQFDIKGIKMNVNYTLDLTTSFNPVNHISLAARLLLGDRGRSKTRAMVYEKYTEGIELYSKGDRQNIQKAIEKWTEAKNMSSSIGIKFDPAIEAITAAQDLLNVHDQIKNFGSLN